MEGELTNHLGYDRHDPAGQDSGNSRNGHRSKTVLTDVGPVEMNVPRDRNSFVEPRIVAKRQRWLAGVDGLVMSLSAKGLTHRGGAGASGRGLRRSSVVADDFHDHRQGRRCDGRPTTSTAPSCC